MTSSSISLSFDQSLLRRAQAKSVFVLTDPRLPARDPSGDQSTVMRVQAIRGLTARPEILAEVVNGSFKTALLTAGANQVRASRARAVCVCVRHCVIAAAAAAAAAAPAAALRTRGGSYHFSRTRPIASPLCVCVRARVRDAWSCRAPGDLHRRHHGGRRLNVRALPRVLDLVHEHVRVQQPAAGDADARAQGARG